MILVEIKLLLTFGHVVKSSFGFPIHVWLINVCNSWKKLICKVLHFVWHGTVAMAKTTFMSTTTVFLPSRKVSFSNCKETTTPQCKWGTYLSIIRTLIGRHILAVEVFIIELFGTLVGADTHQWVHIIIISSRWMQEIQAKMWMDSFLGGCFDNFWLSI